MPGYTPVLGLPYPLITETISPASFAALANAVDAALVVNQAQVAYELDSGRPYLEIFGTPAQSFTVNVETAITLTNAFGIKDTDSQWSAGSPAQWTVNTAGLYMIALNDIECTNYTTITSLRGSLWQNGVMKYAERKIGTASATSPIGTLRGLFACQVGDVMTARMLWTGTGGPATDSVPVVTSLYVGRL